MSGAGAGGGREGALPLRSATLRLGERRLDTRHGPFALHLFRDLAEARLAIVLARGDPGGAAPLPTRIHSSCLTSECLMGCDCDCADQLEGALARIAREGRGVLVYLMQEGRGAGLSAKARDRMLVQASGSRITTFDAYAEMGLPADLRRYDVVASIFALLGIRGPLRLLSNNPEKVAAVARALESEKLEVVGTEPVSGRRSVFNRDYLRAKRGAGHALERPERAPGARPPEGVRAFDPVVHERDPSRLVTASYFLPVALPGASAEREPRVEWFRSSVLVERATGRESLVLSRGTAADPAATPIPADPHWIPLSLLDRFPGAGATGRRVLARALTAIVERGEGCVGVTWDESSLPPEDGGPPRAGLHRGGPPPHPSERVADGRA